MTQPIKEEEDVDLLEEDKLELVPIGVPELPREDETARSRRGMYNLFLI